MVAPLKLNVRLPRVRVCSVEPLRGLVKPRNKLREFGSDDLCRCRLIEVTAGGLAECSHNLAHLLLGRGAQLGDNLLDQGLELLARNLCGQQALQNLDLLGQVVGTLLVGAGLMDISSVSLVCLIRRLIMLLTSSSVTSRRSLTSIFFTSALTWRMMDRRTLSLASWQRSFPSAALRWSSANPL